MKFRYNYYLGTPESDESFSVVDNNKTWTVRRNEDWCYQGWLSYRISIPEKDEIIFTLYQAVYSMLRSATSQDYGIAFDPFEGFWNHVLCDICKIEADKRIGDSDVIIEGRCSDQIIRRIEGLYALLDGSESDVHFDLKNIAEAIEVPFDIEACANDIGTDGACYRENLFNAVYRAISSY